MVTYEQQLDRNLDWALYEGSRHFEKESAVHKTLQRITKRLEELDVPYAILGAMAMFFHGYERFTSHVDMLVRRDGLKKIHDRLEGLGYLPCHESSKHLRDTDSGVRIKFFTTGDFPGDGKPKPVAFPYPDAASVEIDGMRFLTLPALIELKLASGMTNPGRLKDLGDVQEMIRVLNLPDAMADTLNLFVRDKYKELWAAVHNNPS
jgi:hypothetical protein